MKRIFDFSNTLSFNLLTVCLGVLAIIPRESVAQDVQFSQFYATATYLNPAFAGSGHHDRFTMHQRVQWPNLDAKYITSFVAFDMYWDKYQSGLGVFFTHDIQGSNAISTTELALQYSYEVPLAEESVIRFGLQAGVGTKFYNTDDLTFAYQYDDTLGLVNPDNGLDGKDRVYYPDISAGAIYYNNNFWGGIAMHHINNPNVSVLDDKTNWPIKYSLIAGYKIKFGHNRKFTFEDHQHEIALSPTIHYKFQGESDQFDAGLYFHYDHLLVGAWYRGIPFKRKFEQFRNNESIVLMAGWSKYKSFEVRYSYDITVSSLKRAGSGGSHELNIAILLRRSNRKKPMKRLPCPSHHIIKSYDFL